MLRISRERIELDTTVDEGERLPQFKTGIYTKKDSWRLAGIIEDQLHFKCEHVGPTFKTQFSWPAGITRCTFDIHPIDLIPAGWDAMSREDRVKFLQHEAEKNPSIVPEHHIPKDASPDDVSFYATLFEYPLLRSNWGNEVKGETDNYEFVLTKDKSDSDLRVALHSKKHYHSTGAQEDWFKFNAFMNALAFVNGVHAWPYRREYWKAGQKITDRITAAHKLKKTVHAPFSDQLAFSAQTGSIKWDFQDTIRKVASFFEADSKLSREIAIVGFLFREADEGVHSDITTVFLCTLFENVVRLLFQELNLQGKFDSSDLQLFKDAKVEIIDHIKLQIPKKGGGYRRLCNIVQSAPPYSIDQMIRSVVDHFGLKWEGDLEHIVTTWKRARNPLVHGKARAEMSEDEFRASVLTESQIAGAINILLLKLFGYSGHMRHSAFEDGYRQI